MTPGWAGRAHRLGRRRGERRRLDAVRPRLRGRPDGAAGIRRATSARSSAPSSPRASRVADVAGLGDACCARRRSPRPGRRRVDGYGAFRARDALRRGVRGPAGAASRCATGRRRSRTPGCCSPGATTRTSARCPSAPIRSPAEQHRAWLTGVLADPDRTLLVAEHAGRRGRHAALRPRRRPGARSASRSTPEARGRGLGHADDRRGDGAAARRPPAARGRSRRGASA